VQDRFVYRSALEILRYQSRVLRYTSQHAGTEFVSVIEGEHVVRKSCPSQRSMGTGLTLDVATRCESGRLGLAWPSTKVIDSCRYGHVDGLWEVSPCSKRSAITRRARTCARDMASSRVDPYASTPGSCGTSANQRPSSSNSDSIANS
jgi:hypothetical protein